MFEAIAMKPSSLWIIRVALTVQFLGVLAVPAIVLSADSPKGVGTATESAIQLQAANSR